MIPLKSLNLDIIDKLILDGYIKKSTHSNGNLSIYNYTEKAVYDKFWTDETLQCRGLIADKEGNIVSRPFPKFFNLGETNEPLPDEPFEVYEKLDGSLGITYFHEDQYYIASRGSFTSPQAIYATKILRSSGVQLCEDVTYLFEIIYPENRIVVNYGAEESLNLIGAIDTKSGFEYRCLNGEFWSANFWPSPFKVIKKYDGIKDIKTLEELNEKNKEGFVLHFESGLRVKIKFEDYIRLHSIITQMTKRKVWDMVKSGKSFYEFIENIPDELFEWIKKTEESLKDNYNAIEWESRSDLYNILQTGKDQSRKEIALKVVKCRYGIVMFRMLDKKDYSECIWKILEPDHELPVIEGSQFYNE